MKSREAGSGAGRNPRRAVRLVIAATALFLGVETLPVIRAQDAATSAALGQFFGAFEGYVLRGSPFSPAGIDATYKSLYQQTVEPAWNTISPDDLKTFFNNKALLVLKGSGSSLHLTIPLPAAATDDGARAAIESLKAGKYAEAFQNLVQSTGSTMDAMAVFAGQLVTLQRVQYATTTVGPTAPSVLLMHYILRHQVLVPAVTKREAQAQDGAADRGHVFEWTATPGIEGFYGQAPVQGVGQTLDSYGTTLGVTVGSRLQADASVPIYRNAIGSLDDTTVGMDLAVRYQLLDGLSIGGHLNYLKHSGDFPLDHQWSAGPSIGYGYRISDTYLISVGALVDRVSPNQAAETWASGFAVNAGMNLRDDLVLNAYYIYFRDFEHPALMDADWHDLGAEISAHLGNRGTFSLGGKTTLGYDLFQHPWQAYGSLRWRF